MYMHVSKYVSDVPAIYIVNFVIVLNCNTGIVAVYSYSNSKY